MRMGLALSKTLANKKQFAKHRSAVPGLYRTSSVLCRQSAAPKAHSALWSLDAAAYAAAPSKPRKNRHSAKTVCATRRARRRVTEPCAGPPRASVLQPTPLRVGTSSAPRSAAAKPLKYYDGPFPSRERCRAAAPAHCRSAKAREHTSPEAINTNSSTSRYRH